LQSRLLLSSDEVEGCAGRCSAVPFPNAYFGRHYDPHRPSPGRSRASRRTARNGLRQAHYGLPFEAYVAKTLAEFILDNDGRGRIFIAERGGEMVGSSAMVERRIGGAVHGQLRWILAAPAVRGIGLGKRLVDVAMDYAREQGFSEAFLETTDGLDASMVIYRKLGFVETERRVARVWRDGDVAITMRLKLR
jgi:GNAT superfamily N-acetyltransferase